MCRALRTMLDAHMCGSMSCPTENLRSSIAKRLSGSVMATTSFFPALWMGMTSYLRAISGGMSLMTTGSISVVSRLMLSMRCCLAR